MKWKKILSAFKPYKGIFFADMLFACLGAAISLVIPLIVRYITGTVIYQESGTSQELYKYGIIMLLLVPAEAFCNYFTSNYGHVMGAKIERDLRRELFEHYQKLSFSFYDNAKVGQLMSRVTNDLFDITELFHHGPEDVVISVIKLIGSLVILCSINIKLAIAAFMLLPFMVGFAIVLNKKMRRTFKQNRVKIAEVNAQIEDSLSGIRVVKSFSNEDIELQKFDEGNEQFLLSKRNNYRYLGLYHSVMAATTTLVTVVVVLVGGRMLYSGAVSVPDLLAFLLYVGNFTEPIRKLVTLTEQFQNGMSGYDRFYEIVTLEPDIVDKKDALKPESLKGDIEFENVAFKYEDNTPYVFKDLNLHVGKGEYVALVGSSGVGKTTICSLIPRFYEVNGGAVKIDGMDVRDIAMDSLRRGIGIVQQDVYMFAGTVSDNIRYGKPDADMEEVIEAAKAANAHDFIMELPDGYDTYIGQRGVKLSGGQKQRISLARVFLKNPPILIFDEATSALDNESERIVQESLEKLAKGRTTFVIAHRLSTIRNARRILVVTENGIEEEGTHDELMQKGGVYEHLYTMQFKKLEVNT
ncbi:MAG: ABC transporter ATP-binding protein [Lachnospiraceae bacterium]|nr:ABC transporter ATP-binding protein [Lachnospiraceae bacterium]